jgi:hypothetical protein
MIIQHIDNMHQGPVIVRDDNPRFETPDTLGEYRWYVSDVLDPRILQYLVLIIIYKIAPKSIKIYGERD